MSVSPERRAELQALLQNLSDDLLTPDDARRLNDLLHGDPEACELYLDYVTLEAGLLRELGGIAPGPEGLPEFARPAPALPPRATTSPGWPWQLGARLARLTVPAALGALVMLALLLALRPARELGTTKAGDEEDNLRAADCVATLLFADDCRWKKQNRLLEGQRLPAGPLHLDRGLAVVRFDGGAAVVVEGPAELELESRGAARLASGRVTVRAPGEAAGFMVRTPASDVTDLGTEFAVVVERGGATEVHVLEGEVSYGKPGTPQEMADLLGAGKAVRYDAAKEVEPRAVPLNAPRFSELLRQAKIGPREDLLLVHEGFDYPIGKLPLAKADGGIGWAGPWRLSPGAKLPPGDAGDMRIVSGKLNVPWPVRGGRGPMLEATPQYTSRIRTLAQPIRLDEDGVYYVSVMVRWDAPPPDGPPNPPPAVRLVLRNSQNFNGDRVMFNLPVSLRPQIDVRSGATFTSTQTVAWGETQFWVGKIVARRHGEDEIFFRVYREGETLDAIEPGTWSVRTRGVYSDVQLDWLLLTKFGPSVCWFDEVRIGKSWRAVVPAGPLEKKP